MKLLCLPLVLLSLTCTLGVSFSSSAHDQGDTHKGTRQEQGAQLPARSPFCCQFQKFSTLLGESDFRYLNADFINSSSFFF